MNTERGKEKKTLVLCLNCERDFTSPIHFHDTELMRILEMSNNWIKCPYCKSMVPYKPFNMKVR